MAFVIRGERERVLKGDEYDDHCRTCGAMGPEIPYAFLYVNFMV
jgi:hypothetical protein